MFKTKGFLAIYRRDELTKLEKEELALVDFHLYQENQMHILLCKKK